MRKIPIFKFGSTVLAIMALTVGIVSSADAASLTEQQADKAHQVLIPKDDRFVPYVLTIRAGDSVTWVNQDTDDHTLVSNDAVNTIGPKGKGIDVLIKGTDSNGGQPGTFTMRFDRPGAFAYYCRFHAHLDSFNQPAAPGPMGGIKDANGNFGTPMNGVIVVLGERDGRGGGGGGDN